MHRDVLTVVILSSVWMWIIAGCAGGGAYRRAAQSDDPQQYERFLRRHPNGAYARKAEADLDRWRAFEAARRENTPEAYRRFLEKYPTGKTAVLAGRTARALELIKAAQKAMNSGNVERAGKLLGEAVAADAGNRDILVWAGAMALEANLPGEAVAWLNEAVRTEPADCRTRAMLVVALLKAGRATDAVEEGRDLVRTRPKERYVYETLAKAFMEAGLFNVAAAIIEVEREVCGSTSGLVLMAAGAYLNSGDPAGALRVLDGITREDARWAEAVFLRGECFMGLGDYERAHKAFVDYISYRPRLGRGYYLDGVALERLGRFKEAVSRYKQAINLESSDASALWRAAIVNLILGNAEEAKRYFDAYIRLGANKRKTRMAKKVLAGKLPGYEGIAWGAGEAAMKRIRPHVGKDTSSGRDVVWCEIGAANYGGFEGKRCFVLRNGHLVEVRFEAKLGNPASVQKIDVVIKELKKVYGNPVTDTPRVSRLLVEDESVTASEIAWWSDDGMVVLRLICSDFAAGSSRCNFLITWAPG